MTASMIASMMARWQRRSFWLATRFGDEPLRSALRYSARALPLSSNFKGKKWRKDPHAVIEGVVAEDWLVMDLGNIVLHLFQPSARAEWDLEMLWTVGN